MPVCVSSGNLRPAWDPSAQHSPKAAPSQRGASHPCLFQPIKRVLSRSSANPICPPYTKLQSHSQLHMGAQAGSACTFIFQTASGTQTHISAYCLSLGAAKQADLWLHMHYSPFLSPWSLEEKGTSRRMSQRVGHAACTRQLWRRECRAVARACLFAWCLACWQLGSSCPWSPGNGCFVILNSTVHMTGVCFLNSFPLNSL